LELSNLGPILIIIHTELGISANQKNDHTGKKIYRHARTGGKYFVPDSIKHDIRESMGTR